MPQDAARVRRRSWIPDLLARARAAREDGDHPAGLAAADEAAALADTAGDVGRRAQHAALYRAKHEGRDCVVATEP